MQLLITEKPVNPVHSMKARIIGLQHTIKIAGSKKTIERARDEIKALKTKLKNLK